VKRVERWRDSGLSAKQYAAEIGVDVSRLRHWGWRLGKRKTIADPPVPPATAISDLQFVEVPPAASASVSEAEPIEIVAASGLRVRVPRRFDIDALRLILQAIR
jgi:hypothetical protein